MRKRQDASGGGLEVLFDEFASTDDTTLASAFGAAPRTLASLPEAEQITLCERSAWTYKDMVMLRGLSVPKGGREL